MATRRAYTKLGSEAYRALARSSEELPPNPWTLSDIRYASVNGNRMLELFFPEDESSRATFFLGIPVQAVRELAKAKVKDLQELRLSPARDTIIAASLDAYISVEGLLKDLSKESPTFAAMVARLFAARGGGKSTERKRASSAENGRKGGRPRKVEEHALANPKEQSRKRSVR